MRGILTLDKLRAATRVLNRHPMIPLAIYQQPYTKEELLRFNVAADVTARCRSLFRRINGLPA